jgi:hypothetical protein
VITSFKKIFGFGQGREVIASSCKCVYPWGVTSINKLLIVTMLQEFVIHHPSNRLSFKGDMDSSIKLD